MSVEIEIGSVVVTRNQKTTNDPVKERPANKADTFTEFVETVVKSGLSATIYDGITKVANINDIDLSDYPWPPGYGTTEPPWGREFDSVNGYSEIKMTDDLVESNRWSSGIQRQARARESFLRSQAELAQAIAFGIKSAIESVLKAGVFALEGTTPVIITETFTENSSILLFRKSDGLGPVSGTISLRTISPGSPGTFEVASSRAGDVGLVSWAIIGG